MTTLIIRADDSAKYWSQLVGLYIATFSKGKSFQYNSVDETSAYLKMIFREGYGILVLDEEQLLGALLLTPLHFDKLLPAEIADNFNIKRSVYVAEMMVEKTQQGKGIGKKMLNYFFETVDRQLYTDAFIRVWIENETALGLYKKVGFKPCASIVQAKLLADKSGMFDFKKVYLHKKLEG
ncbi:GNAT family N-acetyltransferase [uncultured Draconibacterium sp.]|uniref:GNAT family N-acetyltransferase n=1 Tax=uncultured Draconibacterium sp. TaxID=1573823 RepID=UPI0025E4A73F|nr:GNAT family N-acetyltransferase [uncultured Draconibacterium sp.]